MPTLYKVCDVKDLEPGQGRSCSVGGRSIALFNVAGRFYALEDECTHEGGPLGDGLIEGERVMCR